MWSRQTVICHFTSVCPPRLRPSPKFFYTVISRVLFTVIFTTQTRVSPRNHDRPLKHILKFCMELYFHIIIWDISACLHSRLAVPLPSHTDQKQTSWSNGGTVYHLKIGENPNVKLMHIFKLKMCANHYPREKIQFLCAKYV